MEYPAAVWFILSSVFLLRFKPKTSDYFLSTYDYIVVGSGSAGSVVASRLSEDPGVTVLLLEAGPDASKFTEIPALTNIAVEGENNWHYMSVPQKRGAFMMPDQKMYVPRGKGLGGTTLINTMVYIRGNKKDYDTWSEQGATGWGWSDVFPYFLKSEDNTDPEISNNGYHGHGGYLTVSSAQYNSTIIDTFSKAAAERGYEYRDVNGGKQTGYAKLQRTIRNGRRCSVAKAFLIPAKDRLNLDIVNKAFVTKILINDNKEAYGVLFERDNQLYEVHANKEVIVSGGTVNSPQLLMLSGIGPRDHLTEMGIPVIADLPVGNNLHDHIGIFNLHFEAKTPDFLRRLFSNISETIDGYNCCGTGILNCMSGAEGIAFVNSKYNNESLDWPDLELHLVSATPASTFRAGLDRDRSEFFNQVYGPYIEKDTFSFVPAFIRPKSRGTIRLNSTDPKDHPLIDFNIFEVEEDLDRVLEAIKESVNIVTQTNAFREIEAKMFETKFPGCESYELYSDDYIRCLAKNYTFSFYHLVGTCKMGSQTDETAVVDPRLRVIGVDRLRVVDASIMPNIVSGNTNAAVIMIGEKASDMIKEDNMIRKNCEQRNDIHIVTV